MHEGDGLTVDERATNGAAEPVPGAEAGPFDSGDRRAPDPAGLTNFGCLLVPEPGDVAGEVYRHPQDRSPGVHLALPGAHVRLHVLAAPRTTGLWDTVARDVYSFHDAIPGKLVHWERGPWGAELVIATAAERSTTRFVGVDGPRWMFYGAVSGPDEHSRELARMLRAILRGSVVIRGGTPLPVRTPLPLVDPRTGSVGELRQPGNAAPPPDAPHATDSPTLATTDSPTASVESPTGGVTHRPAVPLLRSSRSIGREGLGRPRSIGRDRLAPPLPSLPTEAPPVAQPQEFPTAPVWVAPSSRPPSTPRAPVRPPRAPVTPPSTPRAPVTPPAPAPVTRPAPALGRPQIAPPPPVQAVRPPMRSTAPPPAGSPGRTRSAVRRFARDRLAQLDAQLAALDRFREVVPMLAGARDETTAVIAVRTLLGVDEPGARAVLELRWDGLTQVRRLAMRAERDDIVAYLYPDSQGGGAQ